MPGLLPPQKFAFFCDESGISNDRFTVVGGICVLSNQIPIIHQNVEEFRKNYNMNAELKWSKVSNQKYLEYQKFVEYFFALNNVNALHFHCIIFDNHQWRHNRYNDGDPDIGISKLYYQLLHRKFAGYCAPHGDLFVCLDHRNSTTPHHTLRDMLNAAAQKDHGISSKPFKQIVSADSKTDDLLQLNDVVLGAVGAIKNGKHLLATTRDAKRNLAKMVLQKTGLQNFDGNTPSGQNRFSVWNFRARR